MNIYIYKLKMNSQYCTLSRATAVISGYTTSRL